MSRVEREFDSLVDQITDMAEAVTVDENISDFDLRRVLRFLTKVIQVVEQAFQDVLTTMIEFKYVSDEDLHSGRVRQLAKELELLESHSRYRDAEEICSRLHHLGDFYRSEIEPITQNLPNRNRWWGVFQLLDEYEGRIIMIVQRSIRELRQLLSQSDTRKINSVAEEHSEAIKESLSKLRSLNSQILGLSGNIGLLELTEDRTSPDRARIFINRGGIKKVGDTYNVGQAGAVGPNAHAHDMTFTQIGSQIEKSIDLSQLADELSKLRQAMKAEATDAEHDIAVSDIAKAEQAAKTKDSSKLAEYLQSAGKWTLEIASKIGVPLAIEALKKATGM